MSDFTPITTQEELDRIIGDRLKREKETVSKKYADYDDLKASNADLTNQLAAAQKANADAAEKYKGYDQKMADLEKKVHTYEIDSVKTRVALGSGLPYEMASRLRGETEDDIRKDAESLKGIWKPQAKQPMASPEPDVSETDSKKAALKQMLHKMNGGNE